MDVSDTCRLHDTCRLLDTCRLHDTLLLGHGLDLQCMHGLDVYANLCAHA